MNPRQTEMSGNASQSPEKCGPQRQKKFNPASQRSSSLPPSNRKSSTPSKRWLYRLGSKSNILAIHCLTFPVSLTSESALNAGSLNRILFDNNECTDAMTNRNSRSVLK